MSTIERIAVVVQRYGQDIVGGSETLARELAERLTQFFKVDVLTTCAKNHATWENAYPEGIEAIRGVSVHRFATDHSRPANFGMVDKSSSLVQQISWMHEQGPQSEGLLRFIAQNHVRYKAILFITYLYFSSCFGVQCAPEKAILVPTAHDEPPIYYEIFNSVFHMPKGIIYLTPEEKEFVNKRFPRILGKQEVIGMGVPIVDNPPIARIQDNVKDPYLLYIGRIEVAKSLHTLFDYFIHFKEENPIFRNLRLYLVGSKDMLIPARRDVRYLGFVDEMEKARLIAGSIGLVLPSMFESFSISTMEGMLYGAPVLVNGKCSALKGHVKRSGAGLYFTNYPEFEGTLEFFLSHPDISARMGEKGRQYVMSNYQWDSIVRKYANFIDETMV